MEVTRQVLVVHKNLLHTAHSHRPVGGAKQAQTVPTYKQCFRTIGGGERGGGRWRGAIAAQCSITQCSVQFRLLYLKGQTTKTCQFSLFQSSLIFWGARNLVPPQRWRQ